MCILSLLFLLRGEDRPLVLVAVGWLGAVCLIANGFLAPVVIVLLWGVCGFEIMAAMLGMFSASLMRRMILPVFVILAENGSLLIKGAGFGLGRKMSSS